MHIRRLSFLFSCIVLCTSSASAEESPARAAPAADEAPGSDDSATTPSEEVVLQKPQARQGYYLSFGTYGFSTSLDQIDVAASAMLGPPGLELFQFARGIVWNHRQGDQLAVQVLNRRARPRSARLQMRRSQNSLAPPSPSLPPPKSRTWTLVSR